MRIKFYSILFFLFTALISSAQITNPVIRANFGVDADLRANFYNGLLSAGNDDWFNNLASTGKPVIDSTGAYAITQGYISAPATRLQSFTRFMTWPMYSVQNSRLLYDAVYQRDHHNNDTTAFTTSNKNGQSPIVWQGGVQPVPNKNDLYDVMLHIRRAGPNLSDSLWLFGGVAIGGVTGDRYFDFELYQSQIYYDMATGTFKNIGPDSGHTAWKFDATGNVTRPGDVIFTAEFGTASLTLVEARIWVRLADTTTYKPANFKWGGAFDGDAGTTGPFGYASIAPKTAGAFYTGIQNAAATWAGPYGFVDTANGYATNYSARVFMEISVNMTKLGLDPYTIAGSGGACNLSFKRVFAKTRSSTSFTSSLKDFIGPLSFSQPPVVDAASDLSILCGFSYQVANLSVTNPLSSSTYNWSTPDGHIITSPPTGTTIQVDSPGTYIVTQTLFTGCNPYSSDTFVLTRQVPCGILTIDKVNIYGSLVRDIAKLQWTVDNLPNVEFFELERSFDGNDFIIIQHIDVNNGSYFNTNDDLSQVRYDRVYYRLRVKKRDGTLQLSKVVVLNKDEIAYAGLKIYPNPFTDIVRLVYTAGKNTEAVIYISDFYGRRLREIKQAVIAGSNYIEISNLDDLGKGNYFLQVIADNKITTGKLVKH